MTAASTREIPAVWIVETSGDTSAAASGEPVRAFGLSARQRLERTLARLDAQPTKVGPPQALAAAGDPQTVIAFRDDCFYDERLVAALFDTGDTLVCLPEATGRPGEAVAARTRPETRAAAVDALHHRSAPTGETSLPRTTPADLVPSYNPVLRKFDPAFVFRASADKARQAEDRMFAASYKGITDFITKYAFPAPACAVVRVLARWGVRPNTVTGVSYALTAAVIFAFAEGLFGLGLVLAWAMTFLDTVDGKLARVTLTSSRLGGFLDHALDLVHPPIWWWAFAVGLGMGLPGVEAAMWITVVGYGVGRALEGIFLALFGMEMFTWRPFDAFFRGIIARRNPNLLLLSLGTVWGRPDWGYDAVALWTLICIAVALARIGQAVVARLRGETILPWYERESPPPAGTA